MPYRSAGRRFGRLFQYRRCPLIDVSIEPLDLLQPVDLRRAAADAPYVEAVRDGHGEAIREALAGLPLPTWQNEHGG